jgi:selenocysteine lyase/cysteine desulfurase
MLPWRRGRSVCLPIPVCVDDVPAVIETALRKLPPGPHLVAMTGASNVTGELLPVRAVSAAAHRVGARVVVDAAQLAGHSPLNMATLGADYLALSGHKMYAPFGSGVLVGRRDWLDAAEPYLPGGGAVVRVDAVGQTWAASPERHEGGTPNVLGAVALATAADALRDHGLGRLARREAALHVALRVGLGAVRGVRLLSMWDGPGVGICSFTVEGIAPALLAAALGAEYGIGVRVGAFCAQPLVSQLVGAETACSTSGPAAVRASVGVGTTVADVEFFLAAVESILTHGPACRYETDGVTWVPVQRSPQLHDELSTLAEPQVVDQTHAHADSR